MVVVFVLRRVLPSYFSVKRVISENPTITSTVPRPSLKTMLGSTRVSSVPPRSTWTPLSEPEGSKAIDSVPLRILSSSEIVPSNVILTSSSNSGRATVPNSIGSPPSRIMLPPELVIDAEPTMTIFAP